MTRSTIRILSDSDRGVRVAAAFNLIGLQRGVVKGAFESDGGFDVAHGMLFSPDAAAHSTALVVLSDHNVVPDRSCSDPSPVVRLAAAVALARIGRKATERRISIFEGGFPDAGKMAALVLGKQSEQEVVEGKAGDCQVEERVTPGLLALLSDVSADVREVAALALGNVGVQAAAPALIFALQDKDSEVRFRCLVALGKIGSLGEEAIRSVARSLSDPVAKVRQGAGIALRLAGKAAAPVLPEILNALPDEDELVQQRLVEALAATEPESTEVVLRLVKMLDGSDQQTRWRIKLALVCLVPLFVPARLNAAERLSFLPDDDPSTISREVLRLLDEGRSAEA
jgi:HEAT repeat protein